VNALLAGVALGVAGSVHCVAMCGPLLGVVAPRGAQHVLHHTGRAAAYIVLGLAAGLAGAGMNAAGIGRWWTFFLAAVLLTQAVSRLTPTRPAEGPAWLARTTRFLFVLVRDWSTRHPVVGGVGVGAVNGLLPCGLVYGATTAAAGLGDPASAIALMAGFALGTVPALSAGSRALGWLRVRRPGLSRLTPLLLVVLAVLLIARALQAPAGVGHVH
jgi:sulfite exporter TauE/SafE